MADKKEDKKPNNDNNKKPKVSQTDKYYKIKADFGYLASYNYKITKEIGRGGYGVVYKVPFTAYAGHQHPRQH
jgi:predicted secreted hydrolase